jgi:tetratricopeptide (TPR) repeat protein
MTTTNHNLDHDLEKKRSNSGSPPSWVNRWNGGGRSLKDLGSISGSEMLEMAALGFSMYEQGRYENAKVIFSGLCALDPREAYYRTALGAVFMVQDDLETAIKLFDAAIALNNRELASYVNRGEVHLRKGRIAEAAADFKSAVALDPENKDPLSRRARLLAAVALQTLEATHGRDALRAEKPLRKARDGVSAGAAIPSSSGRRSTTGNGSKKK